MRRSHAFLARLMLVLFCLCRAQGGQPNSPEVTARSISLPSATVGYPYQAMLPLVSMEGEVTTQIDDSVLPPGLALKGLWITGTPQKAERFQFAVSATDQIGQHASQVFVIDVLRPPARPLTIAQTVMPDCMCFVDYNQPLIATGGYPPYTWQMESGTLPHGLLLTQDRVVGTVRQVLTDAREYAFVVRVRDASGDSLGGHFSLTLQPNPLVTLRIQPAGAREPQSQDTIRLPDAILSKPYAIGFTVKGGIAPLQWRIEGKLPNALRLEDHLLTGIANTIGDSSFSLIVEDGVGQVARQTMSLRVVPAQTPALRIVSTTLPAAYVSIPYYASLRAEGGYPPYTWSVSPAAGAPPRWVVFQGDTISGIPASSDVMGVCTVDVAVRDELGNSDTLKGITIKVEANPIVPPPPLRLISSRLPQAWRLASYECQLQVEGGYPPYQWHIQGDPLPSWAILQDGRISGRPTDLQTLGQSQLQVVVTDHEGTTCQSDPLVLEVKENPLLSPLLLADRLNLPVAVVGQPYDVKIPVQGGRGNRAFVYDGTIAGLTCGQDGTISGQPTLEGDHDIAVRVCDEDGSEVSSTMRIAVIKVDTQGLQIPEIPVLSIKSGEPFSFRIPVAGGVKPYGFSFGDQEPAPDWLELDGREGLLQATSVPRGKWPVHVAVRDSDGRKNSKGIDVVIQSVSASGPGKTIFLTLLVTAVCLGIIVGGMMLFQRYRARVDE